MTSRPRCSLSAVFRPRCSLSALFGSWYNLLWLVDWRALTEAMFFFDGCRLRLACAVSTHTCSKRAVHHAPHLLMPPYICSARLNHASGHARAHCRHACHGCQTVLASARRRRREGPASEAAGHGYCRPTVSPVFSQTETDASCTSCQWVGPWPWTCPWHWAPPDQTSCGPLQRPRTVHPPRRSRGNK